MEFTPVDHIDPTTLPIADASALGKEYGTAGDAVVERPTAEWLGAVAAGSAL